MSTPVRRSLIISLLFAVASGCGRPGTPPPVEVRTPATDAGVDTLAARKQAQIEAVRQVGVFSQFQFADQRQASGISFVHHIVDDAGKHYKAVHYDHGNGIAVADVDGDGRYDIYFVNQVGGNELWRNQGGGRFSNITEEAGVGLAERIGVTASFADTDNDGDQDLFVTTVRGGNALFENDGRGHFTDITKEAGLGLVAPFSRAVFFGYDRGGLPGLLGGKGGRYNHGEKRAAGG